MLLWVPSRFILLILALLLVINPINALQGVRNALELTILTPITFQSPCTHVAIRRSGSLNGIWNTRENHYTKFLDSRGRYAKAFKGAVTRKQVMYVREEDVEILWDFVERMCGKNWMDDEEMTILLPPGLVAQGSGIEENAQHVLAARSREGLVPPLRITPLVQSGPSDNRVDLVFFADGYTASEEQRFINDATRLAEDVSRNQTFDTVRPLLNFWAAFTPSAESGIGVGGIPKDTAFGLYRDGTELRGVYYSKPAVARAACHSLGEACDFPILVGNDDFYGGLGGEFTVITPSPFNGPLVLRHELGHSIIDVGEEYDGGDYDGYFGVNAAPEMEFVRWGHWLTDTKEVQRVERSVMPMQEYAWSMLNTSTPWARAFDSEGAYERYVVRFSLSGLPSREDLAVRLDGKDLGWTPRRDIGDDRWHYDIHVDQRLKKGRHEVEFELRNEGQEGRAQLCSVEVLEFGNEKEFNSTEGFVGAFATYADDYRRNLRPTNEGCLMRVVTTPEFCSVCKEGLWLALLQRVSLVDKLDTSCHRDGTRTFEISPLPLGRFRDEKQKKDLAKKIEKEKIHIRWWRDEVEQKEWENEVSVRVGAEESVGHWVAEVTLESGEVRKDDGGWMGSEVEWAISGPCEGAWELSRIGRLETRPFHRIDLECKILIMKKRVGSDAVISRNYVTVRRSLSKPIVPTSHELRGVQYLKASLLDRQQ